MLIRAVTMGAAALFAEEPPEAVTQAFEEPRLGMPSGNGSAQEDRPRRPDRTPHRGGIRNPSDLLRYPDRVDPELLKRDFLILRGQRVARTMRRYGISEEEARERYRTNFPAIARGEYIIEEDA